MADDDDFLPDADDEDAQKMPVHNSYNQDEATKHQTQADIDAQVVADVLTNPRYDEFFAPYQRTAREDFARHYVMKRQHWVETGQRNDKRPDQIAKLHEEEAYAALWAIQQKKLFDLQCRWRAEEVRDVPDIYIIDDFKTQSLGIENCAALTPISADEFARYLAWATQADYATNFGSNHTLRFDWQNYRRIREALAPDAPAAASRPAPPGAKLLSDYYAFENQHTGHERLLHLPDVRGAKEERYWDAWRAGEAEQDAIKEAAGTLPDPRPSSLGKEERRALMAEFARRFEEPRLNRWRETTEMLHPHLTEADREVQHLCHYLEVVREPVPMPAHADWREAIRLALHAHCHRKLLEALPVVYAEYAQRQQWGIAHPSRIQGWNPLKYDMANYFRGWLLDGRARLGEPQDFDF